MSDLAAIADQHGTSLPSFADDTSMYCSRSTPEEACPVVSRAMFILNDAISSRGLTMNYDKTVSMIICPAFSEAMSVSSGGSAQPVIEYNDQWFTQVNNSPLSGVIVDDKLSWKDHVDAVCPKLARKTGALRWTFANSLHLQDDSTSLKSRIWSYPGRDKYSFVDDVCPQYLHCTDEDQQSETVRLSTVQLYFISVIQPDLEYAMSAILPSMSEFNRNCLHGAWRKAVRCAAGLGYSDSIDEAVKCLHVTKIECRWALQFAMIIRCCHLSIAPADLSNKLSRLSHS